MDTEVDLQNCSPTSLLSPGLERRGPDQDKVDAILRVLSNENEGWMGKTVSLIMNCSEWSVMVLLRKKLLNESLEEDRKEATSITHNDIQRHLCRTATGETMPAKVHDWNMRCQDRATFLNAVYRAVPDCQHDVEGIAECLFRQGNHQSGVPLKYALRARDASIIDHAEPDLLYLPSIFATAAPKARIIGASIRNRIQSDSAVITAVAQLRVPDGRCVVGTEEEDQGSSSDWFSCLFGSRT